MGVIKGQHLRLFLGSKPFALCTLSALHVAAQMQDVSTKDTTDDFAENEPVGFSWDAQATAYIQPKTENLTTGYMQYREKIEDDIWWYPHIYKLSVGDTIQARSNDGYCTIYDAADDSVLAQVTASFAAVTFKNEETEAVYVYIGRPAASPNTYTEFTITHDSAIALDDVMAAIEDRTRFLVFLQETGGDENRKLESEWSFGGFAVVTDISATATNRELSAYNVTLTGDGELWYNDGTPQ